MPKGLFDNKKITLNCPGCGEKMQQSIGRLKTQPAIVCTACGKTIDIKGGGELAKIDEAVDKARKALSKIGKRR